jgi:DNA-binding SARP family transcriptional activator
VTRLAVAVLGPVRVTRDGAEVDLGTLRQREVIAALALGGGAPVPSEVVIERVWGDRAPATARATLHGYVAALRRALEPDRPPRAPATVLVTEGDTYLLRIDSVDRDEVRFEEHVGSARTRLAVVADQLRPRVAQQDRETVEAALDELDDALALWRGTPYAELGDDPAAVAHRVRLEDLRLMAGELRAVGQLALGRHDLVRGELEARTAEHPLHERWWALRAVALARESRQADALAVLDRLRDNLADELGVDPSRPLQELRTAILRQEPSVTDVPAPSASATPVRRASTRVNASAWKLAGREPDLAELRRALDEAQEQRGGFAVLSGGAGIGKSRLVEEVALDAVEHGWRLAVGQCSQDDGAPPLWPWLSVLDALGTPFTAPEPGPEAGGLFRVRADIARLIREAAEAQPLMLVLEDLHWADPSTLGVLRLLAESVTRERLLVVVTWRSQAEARHDLGGVAESLARRHAVRLELAGLDEDATRTVFEEVAGRTLPEAQVTALHRRTQGNPFFVVELARLALGDDRELDEVVGSGELPTTVPTALSEVVERRLATLPEVATTVLRAAAVVGHSFDLETLGDVTRIGPDDLLDAVEAACEAGLLEEDGVEVFRFSHALVADVLCASMGATRLARTHRLVAELLEQRPGREAEVAWHWREAGPGHVGRAWRAAAAAARAATTVYAYVDAATLVDSALELQGADEDAGPEQELDLLQQAIDTYRWAAMLPELVAAVERSIALATELGGPGDVVRAAHAATQTTHRMLWRSAPFGAVNEVVVGALRQAVELLPEDEQELRCRVLVSLANELREEAPISEREQLCEEALALARSLGDPVLLCDVLLHAGLSTWTSANAEGTRAASHEAIDLARRTGDRHALVMALAMATATLAELGRVEEMWACLEQGRAEASVLRIVYAELLLDEVELAWTAASGRFDECEELMGRIERRLALIGDGGDELSLDLHFDLFALRLWQGRPLDALPGVEARIRAGFPMRVFAVVALWRGGRREEAAREFRPYELHELIERDFAFSSPLWCGIAEAALYFEDADLGRHVHQRMAPYAGRNSGAEGLCFGPTDAFLALAARAYGDLPAATAHAERALDLIDAWDMPPAREWFETLRHTYRF